MSKITLGADLDLNKNELIKAVVQNLAAHPTDSPKTGQIYYNTVDDTIYCFISGTTWLDLGKEYDHDNFTPLNGTNLNLNTNKASVLATLETNDEGHVVTASTRIMTLADLGYTGAADANKYVHPIVNPDKTGLPTTGATIISDVIVNAEGHVLDFETRTLLNSDIGTLIVQDTLTNGTHTWSSSKISGEVTRLDGRIDTINNTIAGALVYKGLYNASTNTPNLKTAAVNTLQVGWTYVVSVAGTFNDDLGNPIEVVPGDMIIVEGNNPNNFNVVNKNIPDIQAASMTVAGIIRISTQAENTAGTLNTVAVSPLGLKQRLDAFYSSQRYAQDLGDGTATSFSITNATHLLGIGEEFHVTIREKATGALWMTAMNVNTTTGAVTIAFNQAPTANQFRVKISK